VHERTPVPLAVFWEGCSYRKNAMEGLDRIHRDYHVAFNSLSISGVIAAVSAGLAVGVVGSTTLPQGMRVLDENDGYPPLPDASVTLHHGNGPRNDLVARLAEHVRDAFWDM
jgi:DNA-binding transcriptional LysR family regulator